MSKKDFKEGQSVAIIGTVYFVGNGPLTEGLVAVELTSAYGNNLITVKKGSVLSLKDLIPTKNTKLVVIPQYVADWISYCKATGVSLVRALRVDDIDTYHYTNQKDVIKLRKFFGDEENIKVFTIAWTEGYEVEKEPLYWVRDKNGIGMLSRKDGSICGAPCVTVTSQLAYPKTYTFTEKEIKDYDERYWDFAVLVEDW